MKISLGDCREKLKELPDNSIDSMVTDPPAGIGFMGKAWDTHTKAEFKAFITEVMRECLRVMKPGAYGLVWALPRTSHWTADALEDAGFEIRDAIYHVFGSGFPKSQDVGKRIDAELGCEREVIGKQRLTGNAGTSLKEKGGTYSSGVYINNTGVEIDLTAASSPEAQKWDDWHTALKPSCEVWLWIQKPLTPVHIKAVLAEATMLLEVLLWGLSPVRFVEKSSGFMPNELNEESGSVRWLASMWYTLESLEKSDLMAMFRSPEEARTYWNIAWLWNSILGVLLDPGTTFTTSTETELITELKTLNFWLSMNMPEGIIEAAYSHAGLWRPVKTVTNNSSKTEVWWSGTQTPFVVGNAGNNTTKGVLRILVNIVDKLSQLTPTRRESSALGDVTLPIDAGRLVPDSENWILVRKPLSEKNVAANILKWGTGAMNIGACRIGTEPSNMPRSEQKGRHPSQLILGCSCESKEHEPDCPVAMLDTQSGSIKGSKGSGLTQTPARSWKNASTAGINRVGYSDNGGASRFFYCSKSSRAEKEYGLDDPVKNSHPTIKALKLMEYLVTLVTPVDGTVLDPFMGSGSTGVACTNLHFDFRGYEQDADYYTIARQRIKKALEVRCG